jgi:hypothetical protein
MAFSAKKRNGFHYKRKKEKHIVSPLRMAVPGGTLLSF